MIVDTIYKCTDPKGLAAKLTTVVSRCRTKGESEDHTVEKACKQGIHPGIETQGQHHQESKIGYQWPHKKNF